MSLPDPLFSQDRLDSFLKRRLQGAIAEIDRLDPSHLLNTDEEALLGCLEQKYLVECPRLLEDQASIDHSEAQIDVSSEPLRHVRDRSQPYYVTGTAISLHVPFEGDARLFRLRPSTFTLSLPRATVRENELVLRIETLEPDSARVKAALNRELASIQQYLSWVARDVEKFNSGLRSELQARLQSRRRKLLAGQELASSLGFPLRDRPDSPRTFAAPEVRRRVAAKPPATRTAVPAEPVLSGDDYEHILSVIRSMVQVMERSPRAFAQMKEEHLRDHFLVQLNGHYEGQATGETFNKSGKTDILVRVRDRNVFIAECKFWKGPKTLAEAIDQLLDYTCWRDTKTALIIFNRNKCLSSVLAQIPKVVKSHPCFVREEKPGSETEFRYVMHHRDDEDRELTLTILVFEVPK